MLKSYLLMPRTNRARLLIALLFLFLAAAPIPAWSQDTAVAHKFVYFADRDLKSVSVAGTFNNWDKAANRLTQDGRTWSVTLRLPPGKIQYKFVLNDQDWIIDPANPQTFTDQSGNTNSLLINVPPDYANPAAKGDGVIAASALYHDQTPFYLDNDRGAMRFCLRVRPNDIESVQVVVNGKPVTMNRLTGDDFYDTMEASVPWNRKTDLSYSFRLQDGPTTEWFGPQGVTQELGANKFQLDAQTFKPLDIPDWPQHSVIYQIFPDRFADGDKSNDPPDVTPWGGKPEYYNFFGGDIAGVEQHLGYLKDLGIKLIYFNPVFASNANHRYETSDYFKIDPRFGTNAEFVDLCNRVHADGLKVMLDGVFNHTATNFFAFKDIMDKGPASKYTDWYFIKGYPVLNKEPLNYEAWYGFGSMPKLHMANPETEKYMLGIPAYWDNLAKVDGWRLDVPNEVIDSYWVKFRKVVKQDDDQRWIVGEIWGDGSHWLKGDMFDSVMGYQFRTAALALLADQSIGPEEFFNLLMAVYTSYPPQVARNLMNLIGSHDTPRFLTLCNNDKNLAKLAATIQLTWPGAPSIYYGDELGMEGGKDPDNRRTMRWDIANNQNDMLTYYKELIAARNASEALQIGEPKLLEASDTDKTLAYERVEGKEVALMAVNISKSERHLTLKFPHKQSYTNILDGKQYPPSNNLDIDLAPESAAVLLPSTKAESMRGARR